MSVMELSAEHKKDVERKIVEMVIDGLEKDTISAQEAQNAASFILEKIYLLKTTEELASFLQELSSKWPIFTNLHTIEQGQAKEKQEDAVVQKVEELTESGNIDEALNLAKTATDAGKGAV